MTKHWQMTCACQKCGQMRICLWSSGKPWCGKWLCGQCFSAVDEGIADLMKTIKAGQQAVRPNEAAGSAPAP